jgi:hypothetical protein
MQAEFGQNRWILSMRRIERVAIESSGINEPNDRFVPKGAKSSEDVQEDACVRKLSAISC